MILFDFRSDLHEETLLNSTFYSDTTEDDDKYSNESFSNDDDSFEIFIYGWF